MLVVTLKRVYGNYLPGKFLTRIAGLQAFLSRKEKPRHCWRGLG